MIFSAHLQSVCFQSPSNSSLEAFSASLRRSLSLFATPPLSPFARNQMFNPAFLSAAALSSQLLLNSFLSLVSFLTPLYLCRLYGFLCTSSAPLIFSFRLSLHLYFCPGLFFVARLFIPRSFLRFSTHLPLPLSYLVSCWVFSRFSGDELFSRAQMRPEALILLQQWDKEQSPELTSHFNEFLLTDIQL